MNTRPVVAASLSFNEAGTPFSDTYQEPYHPLAAAFTQAEHVFLNGNQLPQRWRQKGSFVVLETGFGLGNNFLATWRAWRRDPSRCERLVFVAIEDNPLRTDDMRRAHAQSPVADMAAQLIHAWPPLTPNLHSLSFDDGRVQLLLALGDVGAWLPEIVARVDAFYLDGFSPARNPRMWEPRLFKAFARMAAPEATLATWTAADSVHHGLRAAGFDVHASPGIGGQSDITTARFAPQFAPRQAPSRLARSTSRGHALIVGAGLAGCAAAWALSEQGWRSTVLDRHAEPTSETSGNPGGLFHGIVNAQDGTHARFNRAAALHAQVAIGHAIATLGVPGAVNGLLRLDDSDAATLTAVLAQLGLPKDYVRAVNSQDASALSGLTLARSAWFYPGGGWVQPAGLARAWLQQASAHATFRGGVEIARLQACDKGWQLLDAADRVIDEAAVVVLANAGDALRLLGNPAWRMEAVRGQVSLIEPPHHPSLVLPRLPVAGAGYLLPRLDDGRALFGATSQVGDADASVRAQDHKDNLDQLARLLGRAVDLGGAELQGRTGWRWSTRDKLPVIGAVPDLAAERMNRPLDQPRLVPRMPGLYVFTALGSRGITWSTLGARTLASLITGAPSPLEASLLDAIDPARFVSRAVRQPASRESERTRAGG